MLGTTFYLDWEINLILAIQAHFGKIGILISQVCSLLGQQYPLVLLVCILYFAIDKKMGKRICLNLLTVLVWCPMIKNVTFRRRPYFDNENIKILIAAEPSADAYDMVAQGFSFPSAHSACSVAAYPAMTRCSKKKWLRVLGWVLPFIIGISRFCVGAHYPTDVIVGWALGIFVAFIIPFLGSKLNNENYLYLIILLTAIPGLFYCQTTDYFSGFGLLLGFFLGSLFEEKYVNFEKPKSIKYAILRVALGIGVFLLFAQGIKFIIGEGIVVRVIRYTVGAFIALGVFPILFKKFEKEN